MGATFLVTGTSDVGHILPLLSVVNELHRRGHRVIVHMPEAAREMVQAAGGELRPHEVYEDLFTHIRKAVTSPPPEGPKKALFFIRILRKALVDTVTKMTTELTALIEKEKPDVLLSDALAFGSRYAAEKTGTPFATIGETPSLTFTTKGVFAAPLVPFPPGMNKMPMIFWRTLLDTAFPLRHVRRDLGLPARSGPASEFFSLAASETLHIVLAHRGFIPSFPLATQQRFVGPTSFRWPPAKGGAPYGEKLEKGTVLVSTTTTPGRDQGLFGRVLDAVAPMGVPILATAAKADRIPEGLGPHIKIESFVPHDEVFPYVRAVVTQGGWGTVGRALRAGVPMLVISSMSDQPATGRRVAELGIGRHISLKDSSPEVVRKELRALLDDEGALTRAKQIARELEPLDSPALAVDALEELLPARLREKTPHGRTREETAGLGSA